MNPKDKKAFRHDKQVFNQENSEFVVFFEKTMRNEMSVSAAIRALKIEKNEWYRLKKMYINFNGLNS